LDVQQLHWVVDALLRQLVAGLDRVLHQALDVAGLDGVEDAPEEVLLGHLAHRQLAGEVLHEGGVHLDDRPQLAHCQLWPGRHVEGGHMLPQQVLLPAGGELLQEREWALLLRGQVGIDYTGGELGWALTDDAEEVVQIGPTLVAQHDLILCV